MLKEMHQMHRFERTTSKTFFKTRCEANSSDPTSMSNANCSDARIMQFVHYPREFLTYLPHRCVRVVSLKLVLLEVLDFHLIFDWKFQTKLQSFGSCLCLIDVLFCNTED